MDDMLTMAKTAYHGELVVIQGQGNVRHGKLFAENHEAACQRTGMGFRHGKFCDIRTLGISLGRDNWDDTVDLNSLTKCLSIFIF